MRYWDQSVIDHANELANEQAKEVERDLRTMKTSQDDMDVQLGAYKAGYVEGYLKAKQENSGSN